MVLSKASPKTMAIKANNWSDSVHRFLKICSDAGNVDACYTLGMVITCFHQLILVNSENNTVPHFSDFSVFLAKLDL